MPFSTLREHELSWRLLWNHCFGSDTKSYAHSAGKSFKMKFWLSQKQHRLCQRSQQSPELTPCFQTHHLFQSSSSSDICPIKQRLKPTKPCVRDKTRSPAAPSWHNLILNISSHMEIAICKAGAAASPPAARVSFGGDFEMQNRDSGGWHIVTHRDKATYALPKCESIYIQTKCLSNPQFPTRPGTRAGFVDWAARGS